MSQEQIHWGISVASGFPAGFFEPVTGSKVRQGEAPKRASPIRERIADAESPGRTPGFDFGMKRVVKSAIKLLL